MPTYSDDFARRLMIRFGTPGYPSSSEIENWLAETNRLIRNGTSEEEAARRAAGVAFPQAGTHIYLSEGDTISALLAQARKKD